jgi:hypothetical protein
MGERKVNQYELIDTVRGYTESVSSAYKYWTTISFAIIASAYVVGPDLEALLVVIMSGIYLLLAMNNIGAIHLFTRAFKAATGDLARMKEDDTGFLDTSEVMANSGSRFTQYATPLLTIVMFAGSIGTVSYLFYRSGLLD